MANRIEKSFSIGSKEITAVYELRFYSEKCYRLDFEDFLNYQTKKEKVQSKDELDWKFYDMRNSSYIKYLDFIDILINILTKVFFPDIKERPIHNGIRRG